ncbi:MAG: FAD-dependent oxidoreductase [Deltaproteobacteria bacterium]|nr:FAD-dependent oxidoreductase [Deltaproteobacteria bacterium]
MRLADHYDVICAGGGLSSYLCAALLAAKGKRVLVIDDEDQALPRRYDAGFVFDPDFATFTGLRASAALGHSLKDLGIDDGFQLADAIIQVMTPEYRIVFSRDQAAVQTEVRRGLTRAGKEVGEFFGLLGRAGKEVPTFVDGALTPGRGEGTDTTSWKRFWGKYYPLIQSEKPVALARAIPGGSAEVCENLGAAILGAMSYAAPMNLGCEQSIRGLALCLQDQGYFSGGIEALEQRMAAIVLAAGGSVKKDTRVESLIAEGGKIVGVLLSSFEGIIRSDVVVITSRLRRLYATLPDGMRDSTLVRNLSRVVPSSWRFTLSVTVNRNVIPIGATSNMTYIGSYQFPLEEDNYLRIQIIPDGVYPASDTADMTTLLVTALIPYRASSMDYSYLRRLGGKMLRVLSELMPFLENNIVSLYPDFRASEAALREAYPFRGPDWVPENLMQYYVRGHRSVQDFWGPGWTTAHSNLYFAGRSIWPSLGLYGEALTARKIFDDVMLPKN